MTTLVYKGPSNGRLQQIQVGAADLVATFSAASTAWGWMGGLDGIRMILDNVPSLVRERGVPKLAPKAEFHPACCRLLTSQGVHTIRDEDPRHYFSGHPLTQIIGQTVCALSYVMGKAIAAQLFSDHLAPFLVKGKDGILEALEAQIADNMDRLINEGASRGLHTIFDQAVAGLSIPSILEVRPANRYQFNHSDYEYVVGLLKWLTSNSMESYRTRSAVATQVAASLRAIGFSISTVLIWNGQGMAPDLHGGVILVTGGSSETDSHMLSDAPPPPMTGICPRTHHYRFATIGSMLFNMLRPASGLYPATLEEDFTRVHRFFEQNLSYTWTWQNEPRFSLFANFQWSQDVATIEPLPASVALAAVHFGSSAPMLASCFDAINMSEVLVEVKQWTERNTSAAPLPLNVARFQAISAAIVVSLASRVAGPEFKSISHETEIDLRGDDIKRLTQFVDKSLIEGMAYASAVTLLAVLHGAANPDFLLGSQNNDTQKIGFRQGVHAVLPELLFNMSPLPQNLGIRCVDEFFILPALEENGYLYAGVRDHWNPERQDVDIDEEIGIHGGTRADLSSNLSVTRQGSTTEIPKTASADCDIYLSLERHSAYPARGVVLAARVNGKLIGVASITEAQKVIANSQLVPFPCVAQHTPLAKANILQTSLWAMKRMTKPTDEKHYSNYIPCLRDDL